MKSTYKKILFVFTFFLYSNLGFSQSNEIKIQFLGNCGLYLTDGTMNVYVDFPYKSGAFNYMEFDRATLDSIRENSIFIFTHKHPDHYSGKNMRKTLREKGGQKYGKWNIDQLTQLSNPTGDFSVQALQTKHRFSFKHYSYLLTWHGKKIYFSGDTETTDTVLTMQDLDWAFVPYWIAMEVNEQNVSIDTKMVGVYHFYPNTQITNSSPDKIKTLDKQGERIVIPY